jgi:hypothetical protein
MGIVLVRKWKLPLSQTVRDRLDDARWAGCRSRSRRRSSPPLVPHHLSGATWFAILYNVFLAGTLAHWAFFTLARTLPVAVSSMSSLPVPIVGVFAGMLFLGERPGLPEWAALVLVVAAMIAVLRSPKPTPAPPAPDN